MLKHEFRAFGGIIAHIYCVSKTFGSAITQNTIAYLCGVQAFGGWLVRAAFGTALVSSILVVYLAIVAILSSNRDRDRDNRSVTRVDLAINTILVDGVLE